MIEILRGVGALLVAAIVLRTIPDPVQALPIMVLSVIGWIRTFNILWGIKDGEEKEG